MQDYERLAGFCSGLDRRIFERKVLGLTCDQFDAIFEADKIVEMLSKHESAWNVIRSKVKPGGYGDFCAALRKEYYRLRYASQPKNFMDMLHVQRDWIYGRAWVMLGGEHNLDDSAYRYSHNRASGNGISTAFGSSSHHQDANAVVTFRREPIAESSTINNQEGVSPMNIKNPVFKNPVFKKVVFINGQEASQMDDGQIIEVIRGLEMQIGELESIATQSSQVAKQIEKLKKDLGKVAKYLDERGS